MSKLNFVIDRRLVLKGAAKGFAAAATSSLLGQTAFAQSKADAVLLTISDLHAPYARLPSLLAAIRTLKNDADAPCALLINGDIFERGNVVCQRSNGAADWAFLETLAKEMPVIVNVGNHETAIYDDLVTFLERADKANLQVISNLIDQRTNRPFAPFTQRLNLGGVDIGLLGLAAIYPFVYRAEVRDNLIFTEPAPFVTDAFADATADADLNFIMSHAGVQGDKTFINDLPAGTIIQGAHDHLDIDYTHNDIRYFHGGSWGTKIGIVSLTKDQKEVQADYRSIDISPLQSAAGSELGETIEAQKSQHLTAEDRELIANIPRSLDMHDSILVATEAMRLATDADIALIGHTTFGAPLSKGPMKRYDFNAFVRFGGGLKVARVSGDQLPKILARSNQFSATSLEGRNGDYVHAAKIDVEASKTYRLAVNGWVALNQQAYLGTSNLAFEDVEGLELKAVIADHLQRIF